MQKEINDLLLKMNAGDSCIGETSSKLMELFAINESLRFSERDVDFAYLCGVFNASGVNGLFDEMQRLKLLGKSPHDIIIACQNQ